MFSREVEVSFRLAPEAFDAWLKASPGLVEAGCGTVDTPKRTCSVKPGGGAQSVVVTVERATGTVRIHASWS